MIIWRYILLSFMLVFNSNANEFNYDGALNGDGHYELNIDFKLPLWAVLVGSTKQNCSPYSIPTIT